MSDSHQSFVKSPQQLVIVVVLAFVVPIVLITLITQLVTGGEHGTKDSESLVLERIKPVGEVVIATAAGPRTPLTGEQVFAQVCKACHETGVAGSPKVGDKAAWGKVIAQGQSTATEHALKGIRGMPPKGGNPDLADTEVARAVVFMANQAGANWNEPAAPAPTAAGGERTGEQVVAAVCSKCHATGEGGAPKIGDRAAWTARVKRGFAAVSQSALKGHAGMPARGGMADLSDDEVKHAIEYMFQAGLPKAAEPPQATGGAQGKKVYDTVCMACHATGVAGAPKFGDKAAWAPRIKSGTDALYTAALHGRGSMPAKGGNPALSDADVKAAVDYMVSAAK